MTSTISNWYHNHYSTWNRTRRMQAAPFLARTETQASRLTRAAASGGANAGDAVINMGDLLPPSGGQTGDRRKQEALFGPSIGIVNPGPEWADQKLEQDEKVPPQDVLTPELIKTWVEKSKQASQPTTMLQALVNLKRPTLRLSPISHEDASEDVPPHSQEHGIEFQFDCDAPKCGISLHVFSTKDAQSVSLSKVYHAVVDGGFGRVLKLEEGATLELDKLDPSVRTSSSPLPAATEELTAPEPSANNASASSLPADAVPDKKKRFTLRIRKRTHPHAEEDANHVSVAGPALQVVDVETPAEGTDAQEKEVKEKTESGVKVLIRLEALDADEHTLASSNSQATYLHIVRVGPSPASGMPDTRPWVVRVVKREATIGPHTFHLHEIYGLSSHGPLSEAPVHAYPPTHAENDGPTSECLLCLSSPREVVLLPCRHLVACKECAVNMVEFGAGGQLVHAEDAPAETNAAETNAAETNAAAAVSAAGETVDETPGEGSGSASGAEGTGAIPATPALPTPAPAPVPPQPAARPPNPRRKRKAKGWFCPVCRQPYTSLLRISTTAPPKCLESEEPALVVSGGPPADVPPASVREGGGMPRPGFLRVISNAAARVTGAENNPGAVEAARDGAAA